MSTSAELTLGSLGAFLEGKARQVERVETRKLLQSAALLVRSDAAQNFAEGKSPDGSAWAPLAHPRAHGRGGTLPLRDTGLLAASVTSPAGKGHVEEITDTTLTVGSNLDRAALHQHGGTITPTRARALAIPLTPEAWRAGSPRNWPEGALFVWRSQAGKGFLAESQVKLRGKKKQSRLILHYALAASVTVPARPFLGFGPRLVGRLESLAADWLRKAVGA